MDRFVILKPRSNSSASCSSSIQAPARIRLGSGTYGAVYATRGLAIKVYNQDNVCSGVLADAMKEISILKAIAHPNIVEFVDMMREPGTDMPSMAMKYARAGSLDSFHRYFRNMGKPVDMKVYSSIILGIYDGLRYIHSLGIVHRDIKLQNLLYCPEDETVKIADFGSAAVHRPTTELPGDRHTDWVTTLPYRAPEALMGLNRILGPEMDIWSAGVVVFELITNQMFISHAHATEEQALENILYNLGTPTVENCMMPSYFAQKNTKNPPPSGIGGLGIYLPAFSFDVVEYYASGRPHRWGFDHKYLIKMLKCTVRLEPTARLSADEVYSGLLANSAIKMEESEVSQRQTHYENSVANVMENVHRGLVPAKKDMAELRKSIGPWIFEANIMARNIHTRRNFHVASAIWDELVSLDEFRTTLDNNSGLATAMIAVHRISSKMCDTMQYDFGTYTKVYLDHRDHVLKMRGSWPGIGDEDVTDKMADKMEMVILNHIRWTCWRILPIDLEGDAGYGCVVINNYIYRYLIDVAVSNGSNIHMGVNVKRVLEAAAWLEGVISLQNSPFRHPEEDVKAMVITIIKSILEDSIRGNAVRNFYNCIMYENAAKKVEEYRLGELLSTLLA